MVDPRVNHEGKAKEYLEITERGVKELDIKDYQLPNTTIIHTEFYKEGAQSGMIIVGADSHTCSSGGLGTLALGLGILDVIFPIITFETFLQVPDTIRIEFRGLALAARM